MELRSPALPYLRLTEILTPLLALAGVTHSGVSRFDVVPHCTGGATTAASDAGSD